MVAAHSPQAGTTASRADRSQGQWLQVDSADCTDAYERVRTLNPRIAFTPSLTFLPAKSHDFIGSNEAPEP
eukprot:COSAG02_NODE_2190_length_9560_cov_4.988166_12_plen_71_part_00